MSFTDAIYAIVYYESACVSLLACAYWQATVSYPNLLPSCLPLWMLLLLTRTYWRSRAVAPLHKPASAFDHFCALVLGTRIRGVDIPTAPALPPPPPPPASPKPPRRDLAADVAKHREKKVRLAASDPNRLVPPLSVGLGGTALVGDKIPNEKILDLDIYTPLIPCATSDVSICRAPPRVPVPVCRARGMRPRVV